MCEESCINSFYTTVPDYNSYKQQNDLAAVQVWTIRWPHTVCAARTGCCSTPPLLSQLHSCTTIYHLFIYHVWLISSGVSLLWAHTDAFPCSKLSGTHALHKALQYCAKVLGFAGLKHSERAADHRPGELADQCSWYSLLINAAQCCCSPATKQRTTHHLSLGMEVQPWRCSPA